MAGEKLDSLSLVLRDLRMATDIKEEIVGGVEIELVSFADGTRITIPVPQDNRDDLDTKIDGLTTRFKLEAADL